MCSSISVRALVLLVIVMYAMILVFLWFWDKYDCGSSGTVTYLLLFTPSFVAAVVAQVSLQRRSVQVVGATL